MRLSLAETLRAASAATELLVVVDVFRAWATAATALDAGARVLLAEDAEQALALRRETPDLLLAGERNGLPVPEFDFPNSPSLLPADALRGRTLVLATDAGTRAVFAATNAKRILLASFVNMAAVTALLRDAPAESALLLAPGERGELRSLEDTMCSMFLKNAVEDYPNSYDVLRRHLRGQPAAAAFFDPERADAPEEDFERCMALDRYDFVMEAVRDGDVYRLERPGRTASGAQGGGN